MGLIIDLDRVWEVECLEYNEGKAGPLPTMKACRGVGVFLKQIYLPNIG